LGNRRHGGEKHQHRLPEEPSTLHIHTDTMEKISGEGNEKFETIPTHGYFCRKRIDAGAPLKPNYGLPMPR
jgi:hypothetical protein